MSRPKHNCYNCGYERMYTMIVVGPHTGRIPGCSCLKRGIFRSKRTNLPPALTCEFWKPNRKQKIFEESYKRRKNYTWDFPEYTCNIISTNMLFPYFYIIVSCFILVILVILAMTSFTGHHNIFEFVTISGFALFGLDIFLRTRMFYYKYYKNIVSQEIEKNGLIRYRGLYNKLLGGSPPILNRKQLDCAIKRLLLENKISIKTNRTSLPGILYAWNDSPSMKRMQSKIERRKNDDG